MKKSLNYKKMLLCSIVALLATNCGGGGGGGGGSSSAPVKPSISPVTEIKKPIEVPVDKPNKELEKKEEVKIEEPKKEESKKEEVKPEEPKKEESKKEESKKEIVIPKELGKGVKIAILDGDFLKNKDKLESKHNIDIVDTGKGNQSSHGEIVLSILTEGKEKIFDIIAASIGTGSKYIQPSLEAYEKVFEKFDNDGKVKIVNQSWGAPGKDYLPLGYLDKGYFSYGATADSKEAQKMVDFYSDKVNNHNALFIWANGNYDENGGELLFGSPQAQLPRERTDVEKGWISVIGIKPRQEIVLSDGSKGYVENVHYEKHLAWPGGTNWWAISASGESPISGGSPGSSYAVPRVARAAALVSDQYEWMTNSQVKQTLLTTTDMAEIEYREDGKPVRDYQKDKRYTGFSGVNKYGWGVLNTERALGGPGGFMKKLLEAENNTLIDFGNDKYRVFRANVPDGVISEFVNNIRGNAGLLKEGNGRLILKGNNWYELPTFVKEGVLEVHRIQISDINVDTNGTLILRDQPTIGNEAYNKSILNNGRVEVDENITVHINGNYTASKDAVTYLKFGSKMKVKGTTKLDNETKIEIKSNYTTAYTQEKEVFIADELVGDIDSINIKAINSKGEETSKTAKLSQDGNKLIVEMARQNMVEYAAKDKGATKSNLNVAANLETLMQEMDSKVENGTATISELATLDAIQELSTAEINRNAEKLSGEIYASAQNLTFKQASSVNRNLSNHLGDLKAFRNSNYEWQGWASGILSDGKIEKTGYAKADTKLQGGAFGVDKKIDPNTQVGVGIDYSYAKADFDKYAGKFNSDGVGISIYGKKYLANNYYLLGRVGMSKYSTRVSREILDKNLNTVDNGNIKHHDKMISSYVEAGKHFANFTPFIGYSYDNLRRGSFGENNGSWGIVADAKNYAKNSILLGVRAEYEIDRYTINGHLTHAINVGDRSLDFEGRFAGSDTGVKFKGIEQSRTTTWAGIGVSRELTKQISANATLDIKFDGNKNSESLLGVGVSYKF